MCDTGEVKWKIKPVCGVQTFEWTPVVTASMTTRLHDNGRLFIVLPDPANNVV